MSDKHNQKRGPLRYDPGYQKSQSSQKRIIKVPSSCIGKIIGRGGSKISSLERDTTTKINVFKSHSDESEVEVIGDEKGIEKAERLIKELLSSDRYGGQTYTNSNRNGRGDHDRGRYSNSSRNDRGDHHDRNAPSSNEMWDDSHSEPSSASNNKNDRDRGWSDRPPQSNSKETRDEALEGSSSRSNKWGRQDDSYEARPQTRRRDSHHQSERRFVPRAPQNISEAPSTSRNQSGGDSNYEVIDFAKLNEECVKRELEFWSKFPPVIKSFYKELPEIANMSEDEVQQIRSEKNNIVVERPLASEGEGGQIKNPIYKFEHAFHNFPEVLEEIKKVGFSEPTPIQCQAWPILLSGEDLIGIAQTGTGKTLAFLLPAMIHIDNQTVPLSEKKIPSAVIMAPTRELALQIEREVSKYNYKDIKSVCIYGGASRSDQINIIEKGVDIIIATPGRLDDLIVSGFLDITGVTYAVLDEADRMLDMGFEPQIRKTMYKMNPNRQTVMTSATWPAGVRRLAMSYMKNPVQVYVGTLDLAAVHSVTQTIVVMEERDDMKFETFMKFMKTITPDDKVIVFTTKKSKASELCVELHMNNITCVSIHGDMEQRDREEALEDMMSGQEHILIATDVASRGIDIENVTLVLNYDFPRNIEEYVHRVGRTGRAGQSGESITYFTRSDARHAAELIKILEEAEQNVPEELREMARRRENYTPRPFRARGRGRGGHFSGGFY